MSELARLFRNHALKGTVSWIGVRSARLEPVQSIAAAELLLDGLTGDHARPGKRAVTLLQAEHLPVIAALSGLDEIAPETLRRNIVVSGINLTALRHNHLKIGSATVAISVPCAPCSRMEKVLGTGGYNAVRGHGGWCAEVIEPGRISVGDSVAPIFDKPLN